ncbi:16S rRNA (cytidine(1402)-2'-O)-methyltransferase [Aquibacillus salsiterrae]|uniref:Ribosomal RNA small subunit methyltransferase I n=1 Tax=Aquibacillus salsiterrae TaxID=2950439 RepID=A0A9X3WFY8_9BACI|nr:16S rRNA (cytidine(1402)-2'-O)-methyltransferase [Aquibacillus salsiterrae]MDC3417948.1 16S rRNA (cytidine(1402)-2'-O)-methyltransferase [Aquibacillus salsiterrae]
MKSQKSFQENHHSGTLFIVPTPIGNLEDITIRALNTLKAVEVVAAEDTRNTRKLLNYFEIKTTLISYHEHNKEERENRLLELLADGQHIALVSDAGMPAISDPGYEIVKACIANDYPVVVLPGASAALCALVGSGLRTDEFYFYGFLPRKKKERDTEIERIKQIQATILFYESPHRISDTLQYLSDHFGDREMALARELTKKFEEYVRGTASELLEWSKQGTMKGEFCIVVEGNDEEEQMDHWWENLSVIQHVNHYIEIKQWKSKDAIKKVAEERNIPKRDVYQAYHVND